MERSLRGPEHPENQWRSIGEGAELAHGSTHVTTKAMFELCI